MKKIMIAFTLLMSGGLFSVPASADDATGICTVLCQMQLGGYACECGISSLP